MSYMPLLKNVFSFSVTEFCFVFFGYVSMFLVVQDSVYPMQGLFLPENSTFAALLFLPHVIKQPTPAAAIFVLLLITSQALRCRQARRMRVSSVLPFFQFMLLTSARSS